MPGKTVDHAEAKPAAFSHAFGRVERIESFSERFVVHAGPGIRYAQQNVLAVRHIGIRRGVVRSVGAVSRRDDKGAAIRHGIACVDRKIEDGCLQTVRIDICPPKAFGELRSQFHVVAQCPGEQPGHITDDFVDIAKARCKRLTPGKCEKPLVERGAAPCGTVRRIDQPGQASVIRCTLAQQFEVALNDRKKIVEIVRDATGKLSDGVHLVDLPQLLFGKAAFGNIRHRADITAGALAEMDTGAQRTCLNQNPFDGFVASVHAQFHLEVSFRGVGTLPSIEKLFAVFGMYP